MKKFIVSCLVLAMVSVAQGVIIDIVPDGVHNYRERAHRRTR